MWTVLNLVDKLCDRYDFYIVTRNYESKGDTEPYTSVTTGDWNSVGNPTVYYLGKGDYSLANFVGIFETVRPDAVFLNSAFSLPVIRFLTIRRKKLIQPVPVVLACGEMSKGALSIKPLKKKLFLTYSKAVWLYAGVLWKASTVTERDEIHQVRCWSRRGYNGSPDLAPKSILPDFDPRSKAPKKKGRGSFSFLSRITRKKNLGYFLECLADLDSGRVTVDVLGPVEDEDYWSTGMSKTN